MSAQNRASRISKLQTLLKKAYKPIIHVETRTLMEHLLYACLLENAPYELADEALARLEQEYFDWNEVRVTTITELSEVLVRLPDAQGAAVRLKKNLHGIFESMYTFDLEELRKLNLGKAIQKFERLPSMTPFVLAYITQHGLGGHAIPLDSAALRLFWLTEIINEKELKTGKVTGLERAVPKNKGVEFASLLHQAAVAINIDPNDQAARQIVVTLNPDLDQKLADHVAEVKQRRVVKAKAKAKAKADADAEEAAKEQAKAAKSAGKSSSKAAASKAGASKSTTNKSTGTSKASGSKTSPPKATTPKASADKASADKANASKASTSKKSGSKPSETKSAAEKPATEQSADSGESTEKTASSKSTSSKSTSDKPSSVKKTAANKPAEKSSSKSTGKKTGGGAQKAPETSASAEQPAAAEKKTAAKPSGKRVAKRKPR